MKVFSASGTQVGMKWKTAGKEALSKKPIIQRINSAKPKDCLQAMGTRMVRTEGIKTLKIDGKKDNIWSGDMIYE